jgi:hypothetical protein
MNLKAIFSRLIASPPLEKAVPGTNILAAGGRIRLAGAAGAVFLSLCGSFAADLTPSGKSFAPLDDSKRRVEVPENAFATVPGKDPNGWSFTLEPYLWALGMSGDIGVKGLPAVHVDYKARGILQHLDWAVMGKGELRKGKWAILGDGLFAQLSASTSTPGPLYTGASLQVQQGMASLALAYRVIDDRRWFVDVYAGARYNYLGFQLNTDVDSSGIGQLSEGISQRIVEGIGQRATDFLVANKAAIASEVQTVLEETVTTKALGAMARFPSDMVGSLSPRELVQLSNTIRTKAPEYRQLIAATAQAKTAEARNQLTPAIRNQVTQAQQKLAKAIAREIEKALPTDIRGDQWWVDPMVGLRAQVNITRWLFLAVQGDVGGFGAGSNIAWNAQGSIGVNLTRNLFLEAGWRYFYMDYARDGAVYEAAEFGVFSGIGVKL